MIFDRAHGCLSVNDEMDGRRELREFELDLIGVSGVEVAVGPLEPSPPLREEKEVDLRRSAFKFGVWDEVDGIFGET